MQTALKVVQMQRWEFRPRLLTQAQFLLSAVSIDKALVVLDDRIWCLLRLKLLPMLRGKKGGACGTVYAASVSALGKMLSSDGVSDVMSCAGLVSVSQTRTTHAHSCTNDSSKCATGMCQRTMSTLVFCGESRCDFRISPRGQKLPHVNASRFQSGANS